MGETSWLVATPSEVWTSTQGTLFLHSPPGLAPGGGSSFRPSPSLSSRDAICCLRVSSIAGFASGVGRGIRPGADTETRTRRPGPTASMVSRRVPPWQSGPPARPGASRCPKPICRATRSHMTRFVERIRRIRSWSTNSSPLAAVRPCSASKGRAHREASRRCFPEPSGKGLSMKTRIDRDRFPGCYDEPSHVKALDRLLDDVLAMIRAGTAGTESRVTMPARIAVPARAEACRTHRLRTTARRS